MPKNPPPPFQGEAGRGELPRTLREAYAEALKSAERDFREAQAAMGVDDSNENRARYAQALFDNDQLRGMFPFVAAGVGDAAA